MRGKHCVLFLSIFIALYGCQSHGESSGPSGEYLAQVMREGDTIFIVDQTGKRWNVTHAVNDYGFVAEEFQFGLGPNAIRPILEPKHIGVDEAGYPSDDANFILLGAKVKYWARAYSINVMAIHEVVDEVFGDVYVAVAF